MSHHVAYAAWDGPPADEPLPWVRPGFGWTELVASWEAETPPGSWIEVAARAEAADGSRSEWQQLGRWTSDPDAPDRRSSVPGQRDRLVTVDVDVVRSTGERPLVGWQLRVSRHAVDGAPEPVVHRAGAVASTDVETLRSPEQPGCLEIRPGAARGTTLELPAYAQHRYPGGEGWCSPTSVAMVVDHWGHGGRPVGEVAAAVFDQAYDGAGNWSFNTAYAASTGLRAFVTRLRSLDEAEQFIAAGIPLVASVSFRRDQLTGAGYDTAGHLLVLVGFTAAGDVVCHDPAAHGQPDEAQVRVTYDRAELEACWLTASGGMVYVIHPAAVPLPPAPEEANW